MVRYDPQTALVVVDVQNDFADPAGSLAVRGGHGVVVAVNAAVEEAQAAGSLIVAEAGGQLTGLAGEPIDIRAGHLVASNGHVHPAMLEIIETVRRNQSPSA